MKRRARGAWVAPGIWFTALGLVVLGPLLAPGYLLLLDFPTGPNSPWPSLMPLPSEGLVNVSAPFAVAVRAVGLISPQLPNKLLVLFVIVTGAFGLFRFLVHFSRLPSSVGVVAATFYVVNPFVYDRLLAGQLFFATGYALLPWMLPSLAETCTNARKLAAIKATAWTGLISVVDIHAGGMAALLLVLAICFSSRRWTARLWLIGVGVGVALALNLFWLIPSVLGGEPQRLGAGDLLAYAPRPRSAEILPRVLMLHGFWRTEFDTPLESNTVLFLTAFIPVVAAAAVGAVRAMRFDHWRRAAAALGSAALVAIVLGMGTSFPVAGRLTDFLFRHVPGYGIFREPQKWIGLLALAYAVFGAVALQAVADRLRRGRSAIVVAAALPLLATPMLIWGFGGKVELSHFPNDWARADEIMGSRDGNLLFLPWNLYQPIPFAGNRTIANPGVHFFGPRTLVSGDAALARRGTTGPTDPRDDFAFSLVRDGDLLRDFGHLTAPLGVRFVALAHVADAPDYRWLNRQEDLRRIFAGDDLTLYENEAWRGDVYELEVQAGDQTSGPGFGSPSAERSAATQLRVIGGSPANPLPGPDFVRSAPGWEQVPIPPSPFVGTEKSCGDGWKLGDEEPVCHLGVAAAFDSAAGDEAILWRPGIFVQLLGWLLSLLGVVGLVWSLRRTERNSKPA